MAAGKLAFSEQRFLVWGNEEGPSYAGLVDKETSETGFTKRQRERYQPVVFRNCACALISDTGTYSSLQDFRRTSKGSERRDIEIFETKSEFCKRCQFVRLAEAILCVLYASKRCKK